MNRASKMGGSLSRKMFLLKKVDYQEEWFLKEEKIINCSSMNGQLKEFS